MQPMKFSIYLSALFILYSCGPRERAAEETKPPTAAKQDPVPPKGTVIAADSIKVADPLNESYFAVRLVAGEYSFRGTYDIKAHYGSGEGNSQITFPRADVPVRPAMRRGDAPESFIIGFYLGDDKKFYDYFLVDGQKNEIKMKYLKAYSFR